MITPNTNLRTGKPLWLTLPIPKVPHQALSRDKKTDIVIIGAGISGAMAAQELAEAGFKVMMLDKRGPLKGATSATTALLQYDIDKPLTHLTKHIGHDKAMRAWRRSKLGLESLKAKIQSLDISCHMKTVSSLYLAGNVLDAKGLRAEGEARNTIGLHSDFLTRATLLGQYNIKRNAALMSFDNLSVNPLQLAAGFLLRAIEAGVEIFAPVTVNDIETGNDHVVVHTSEGPTINARHLIYATGYEIPNAVHTKKHSLHSTYAIATRPQPGALWPGKCLLWEASDPYLYIRATPDGRVICGGEDEEFKDEEKRDALLAKKTATLEKKLATLFPQLNSKAEFAWCGSFGASSTGLPTIGALPGMKNCFAILAFGGNGITYSRIAAELLTSKLTGKNDPEEDLFAFN